jgi:uncharacterized protein DUF4338
MARATSKELKAEISRRLRRHISDLGFVRTVHGHLSPPGTDKDILRALHGAQRSALLRREAPFVRDHWPSLKRHFASGREVQPTELWPRLELVESRTWQSNLFRLASLSWSMPVSQGYGRRLRFLVWDDFNQKLVGLIALGDPVFNLRVRDDWIGWNAQDRKQRLVNVLDAYVLGAIPPYSSMLGGKLVASLVRTQEVRDYFAQRYAGERGIISRTRKRPALVMVTTTSAFGRSSLYNRLRFDSHTIFRSLGYTQGYGHFHVPDDLFDLIRRYLRVRRHSYASNFQFGDGPNWKMRTVRQALRMVGLNPRLIRHGVQREVFGVELAANARAVLRGEQRLPDYTDLFTVAEMGCLARERWVVPRALTNQDCCEWDSEDMLTLLRPGPPAAVRAIPRVRTGTDGAG